MRISDWSSDVCSSDLARCHRVLPAAPLALPQPPARQLEGLGHPTVPAAKAVGPPARRQVLSTRVVIPELGLELLQRLGEIWPAHPTTLSMGDRKSTRLNSSH